MSGLSFVQEANALDTVAPVSIAPHVDFPCIPCRTL